MMIDEKTPPEVQEMPEEVKRMEIAFSAIYSTSARLFHVTGQHPGALELHCGLVRQAVEHAALFDMLIESGLVERSAYFERVAERAERTLETLIRQTAQSTGIILS